jgi:hypothetical protein
MRCSIDAERLEPLFSGCNADSGGRLWVGTPDAPVQLGVVSWGDRCGAVHLPSVFADVAWIAVHHRSVAHLGSNEYGQGQHLPHGARRPQAELLVAGIHAGGRGQGRLHVVDRGRGAQFRPSRHGGRRKIYNVAKRHGGRRGVPDRANNDGSYVTLGVANRLIGQRTGRALSS